MALRCKDGLVMASDSQATESTGVSSPFTQVKSEVEKIFPLGKTALFGCAGMGQVSRDLVQSLKENEDLIANSPDLRRSLLSLVRPVLETHYAAYLPTPGGTLQPP
jgi:20S proteasome alpha/beta subunit